MSEDVFLPHNFPYWMLVFSFIASLLFTILAIIEGVCRIFQKATLDIVLTREVFFRILESGESLYTNAVLVAYNSGALIQDLKVSLKKQNGATKTFTMRVAQIGEKFRTQDGVYQFSFHSTSPLSFIPPSNPQRQVYVCEHESYSDDTRQCFQRFQQNVFQIKEWFGSIINPDPVVFGQLDTRVQTAVNDALMEIMDKVQIEPGNYTLYITITYRQKGKYFPFAYKKNASSKVKFTVKNYARDLLRHLLREYLLGRTRQIILNQQSILSAPEYLPADIYEDVE